MKMLKLCHDSAAAPLDTSFGGRSTHRSDARHIVRTLDTSFGRSTHRSDARHIVRTLGTSFGLGVLAASWAHEEVR